MSILSRKPLLTLCLCVTVCFLSGCKDIVSKTRYAVEGESKNMAKMTALPRENWASFAQSLEVEERLNLHLELWEHSGHPPDSTLQIAFRDQPHVAYTTIVNRAKKGDFSPAFIGVLIEIDRSETFSICDQSNRIVLQEEIQKNFQAYVAGAKGRFKFLRC